jgi:hypothetical protein
MEADLIYLVVIFVQKPFSSYPSEVSGDLLRFKEFMVKVEESKSHLHKQKTEFDDE